MANQDLIESSGTVIELLPDAMSWVKLDHDHQALAHIPSNMRKRRIRVLARDRVYVEMTPDDLSEGCITVRFN
jgi:translation initiation factor IF-1